MGLLETLARLGRQNQATDDRALLKLIQRDPPVGWRAFLDRYSGRLLAWVRDYGFDHDEAMERFVLVCEKLAEHDCQRLREVRRLGDRGELVPWLRQVVHNTLVSWAWSEHGRPRLLKSIEGLGELEQQVFHRHYWQGLTASEIFTDLLAAGFEVELVEVYAALTAVHGALSENNRWRLISRLSSRRPTRSLTAVGGKPTFEPAAQDDDPEREALAAEASLQLQAALVRLTERQRLVVRLHYDDGLKIREIADLLDETQPTIRGQAQSALARLRQDLRSPPRSRTA